MKASEAGVFSNYYKLQANVVMKSYIATRKLAHCK